MLEFSHKPVMLEECMEGLSLKDGGIYFDGTVGGGGHSYEILKSSTERSSISGFPLIRSTTPNAAFPIGPPTRRWI